jgi:hypothetical protein
VKASNEMATAAADASSASRAWTWAAVAVAGAVTLAALAACGGSDKQVRTTASVPVDANGAPKSDGGLCDHFVHWMNNPALEVSETAGAGSIRPNIRRVYKVVGDHDDRRSVLLCREIDTNLDGIKDVVRTFNEKGEPLHEEADTNYDGKVDDWVNFAGGRIEEEDVDTTYANGRPNVWKFYVDGQLSRIRRNTHCPSGKADTWEIYFNDRLERVGNDATCDGHVDRWDRDTQLMAAEEAAQDKANAAAADAGPGSGVTIGVNGEIVDGGAAKTK